MTDGHIYFIIKMQTPSLLRHGIFTKERRLIMKKAFSHLENLVNSRGIDYIFLVPATEGLFSMYEKLGFKTGLIMIIRRNWLET